MKEFLKIDDKGELDDELYQRCRYYADYLSRSITEGRMFLFSPFEYASWVYRNRITCSTLDFNLQKAKQALDHLGYESNTVEYEILLGKLIKN